MSTFTRTAKNSTKVDLEPVGRSGSLDKIYVGFVKEVIDPLRMGRLKVWIPELGGTSSDKTFWHTVSYASPFAGATDLFANTPNNQWKDSQRSYGMWFIPPDKENQVLVCFINGDPGKGIWFACLFQERMNHMIPGIPGNESSTGLPVGEYNKTKKGINLAKPDRPEYLPLSEALKKQGLDQDTIRGSTNSGVRRNEAPDKIYGLLTPEGSQLVFDENPANTFIRLRTKTGVQIMLNDSTGEIYMITSQGENWFSMTADGTVEVYASNDITLRTEQNLNLRADLDINIEAGRNMFIKARGDSDADSSSVGGGMIQMNANSAVHLSSFGDMYTSAKGSFHRFAEGSIFDTSKGSSNYKAVGTVHIQADGGDVEIKAAAEMHATATNIHLNSMTPRDASAATAATAPTDSTVIDNYNEGDTYKQITRKSILYNFTHHEPYNHNSSEKIPNGDIGVTVTATDPAIRLVRNGEIVPNQNKPLDYVGGDGYYEGKSYDSKGNPVYEFKGGSAELGPCGSYRTSPSGMNYIKKTEAYRPMKYPDPPGQTSTFSIGFGHKLKGQELPQGYVTINGEKVYINNGLTRQQATDLFMQDLIPREEEVKKAIKVKITQNQFDALVSFVYNVGHLQGTSIAKAINSGNIPAVSLAFMEYVRITKNGQKVTFPPLIKRRQQELRIFFTGTPPTTS